MKKRIAFSTMSSLVVVLFLWGPGAMTFRADARLQTVKAESYKSLPKPGEKIPLAAGYFFVYSFDKPPKLGTTIMRVEIFNRDGRRDTTFVVKGDADMPSMSGAHQTGNKEFSLSAKGVYLLPVQLVMPGEWELRLTFEKDGKPVLFGAYRFEV